MTAKAEGIDPNLEKVAEALWNAEFLLVVAGPLIDDARSPLNSEFCDPSLVAKPNKFMGFWGGFFNEYMDRTPNDGFSVLVRWRDKLYCQEDIRKKKGQKRTEDENELDMIARCNVYTNNIGNMFQKAGFPNDEVFEACGNITTWQCSRNPPCCSRVWNVDRGFRFNIDETNQEALPIKYVPDKKDTKGGDVYVTVDDDEEDLESASKAEQPTGTDQRSIREAAKRTQRKNDRALVIRIAPNLQVGTERFPDLFSGYATAIGGSVEAPVTFHPEEYREAMRLATEAAASASLEGTMPTGGTAAEPPTSAPPPTASPPPQQNQPPCLPPKRVSHLLAHVDALDRQIHEEKIGRTYCAEPERWQKDRELQYQSVSKFFQSDCHGIAVKRSKFATYNVSVVFTQSPNAAPAPSCDAQHEVLPEYIRDQLLAVYPPGEAGEYASNAAQMALRMQYHDNWTQGKNGWFYFSNVQSKQTMQEPVNHKYHDLLKIPFPNDEDGRPTVPMPSPGGRVSVVVETVVREDAMEGGAKLGPNDNPYTYTRNVWQVVGEIAAPDFRDPNEFKGKEDVEYVIETRKRHVVKIGTKQSAPNMISYINIEAPCDETDPEACPSIVSRVTTTKDTSSVRTSETLSNLMGNIRRDDKSSNRPPVPTQNHQLCVHCHDVGRPFVLMSRPGNKDEGFCAAAMAARTKSYKTWEKNMMDAMKQDNNKSLVLLELGCDKKMDAARTYSEKTFKQLKSSKCTFVRISPLDLETKKKQGAGGDTGNYVAIQGNIVGSLNAIDRLLTEKMRKKGN